MSKRHIEQTQYELMCAQLRAQLPYMTASNMIEAMRDALWTFTVCKKESLTRLRSDVYGTADRQSLAHDYALIVDNLTEAMIAAREAEEAATRKVPDNPNLYDGEV